MGYCDSPSGLGIVGSFQLVAFKELLQLPVEWLHKEYNDYLSFGRPERVSTD